jgi:uncharacterized protein YcfJ
MKKTISTFILLSMFTLFTPLMQTAAAATVDDMEFADFYELADSYEYAGTGSTTALKPCPSGTYRVRKNTRKKTKIVNSLIAGGVGAAIGGGIGGGRGALIGLGSGAGGYLVYRYVRDSRGRCVPRYVRG